MAVAENIDLIALIDGMLPDFHAASIQTLDFWSQQDLLDWADEGVKRLAKEAACWVERYTAITTANATRAYPLAARHIATLQVSYGTNPLRPASAAELEAKDSAYQTTAATADTPPSHWYEDLQRAEYVSVVPVPVAAVNLPIIQTIYPEPSGGDFSVTEYPATVEGATVGPTYDYEHDGTLAQPEGTLSATLLPNRPVGYDGNSAGRGHPGFEYDGAQYAFLANTTGPAAVEVGFGLHAMKSTDGGENWTELDSANHPAFNLECTLPSYVVERDGTSVIVLSAKWTGTDFTNWTFNEWEKWTFNLTTGLWSARSVVTGPNPARMTGGGVTVGLYMVVRGTGDYLLICSTGSGQFSYATFDGSTIGAWVAYPAGYITGAAADSSGRTYAIRKAGTLNIYCDVVLANNTLQAPVTVKTGTATLLGGTWDDFSDLIVYNDGAEKVAFAVNEWRSGVTYGMRLYAAAVGDVPAFSPFDIDNTGVGNDGQTVGGYNVAGGVALAYANGTLAAIWQHADDVAYDLSEFVYATSTDGGTTWSAPATLTAQSVPQSYYAPAQAWAYPVTAGVAVLCSFQMTHSGAGQGNDEAWFTLIPAEAATPDRFYLSGIEAGQVINITFSGTAATITLLDNLTDRNVYATYNDTASIAWTVPEGVTSAWLEVSVTN